MDPRALAVAEKIINRFRRGRRPPAFESSDDFRNFIDHVDRLVADPESADLEYFLKLLFNKESFRPGQKETVLEILLGRDAIALFPTGSGKSISFQLAAMLMPGCCLVIEPTLSLIDDQIANLTAAGINRAVSITSAISGADELADRIRAIESGDALFCYVTPERLNTSRFRAAIRRLHQEKGVGLIAVDEAHCVSEWGHDFRTSYLTAGRSLGVIFHGNRPPIAALTATASDSVLLEIRQALELDPAAACIRPPGAVLPAPEFRVVRCPTSEKFSALRRILESELPELWPQAPRPVFEPRGERSHCGLIFCPHIDGPVGVRATADFLNTLGLSGGVYHGRPPAGVDPDAWSELRKTAARRFKDNESTILVATKSFGLGIDKPNIRFTIHLAMPTSMEALRQESGRAGRDGQKAVSWVLSSIDDASRASRLLAPALSPEEIAGELERIPPGRSDDLTRALQFHVQAFRGISQEKHDINQMIHRLGNPAWPGVRLLALPNQHQPLVEKALYRLLCLGIISDYTVRYRENGDLGAARIDMEYEVQVAGAKVNAAAIDSLLNAVYSSVEKTRRESLRLMAKLT